MRAVSHPAFVELPPCALSLDGGKECSTESSQKARIAGLGTQSQASSRDAQVDGWCRGQRIMPWQRCERKQSGDRLQWHPPVAQARKFLRFNDLDSCGPVRAMESKFRGGEAGKDSGRGPGCQVATNRSTHTCRPGACLSFLHRWS